MSIAQIATAGLVFEEATHRYFLNGTEVPSVTATIRDNRLGGDFSRVDPAVLDRARQLGSAVHVALHYYDEGTLDTATVDPAVWPYLEAWARFKTERDVTVLVMEQRLADPVHRFGGTLDRIAVIDGRRVLIDVKSGSVDGADLQTAAYARLAGEPASTRRWAVQLHPERQIPYTVYAYQDPNDWRLFRSALELTHERARRGRHWHREAA